jgi:cyclic dehypoxanthinyl futalosine synthase
MGRVRIGGVTYLNAQPLIHALRAEHAPTQFAAEVDLRIDYPSRLADGLAAGELDVAIIPSIEYLRQPGRRIVSDACIACDGAVRSVKLYGRVRVEQIRSLSLDEGSRTSAALVRILLKERFGLEPELRPMPLGMPLSASTADAVMLIGDRGMRPPEEPYPLVWDLGEEWSRWTGLPFVFALWVARADVDVQGLDGLLSAARDEGLTRLAEIAAAAAPAVGLPEAECLAYLRDHLSFHLGPKQRQGLQLFYDLAVQHGLAGGTSLTGTDTKCWSAKGMVCRVPLAMPVSGAQALAEPVALSLVRAPSTPFVPQGVPPPTALLHPKGARPAVAHGVPGSVAAILDKAVAGRRIDAAEGLRLLESCDLAALAGAADAVSRRLHPEPYRTYNIDRNINYTNICTSGCRFCAFFRKPGDPEGYVIGRDELFRKIEETIELGGDQILLQGGMHPDLSLAWYEELLADIKRHFPQVNIHGLSPTEIDHLAGLSGRPVAEVLGRLRAAGLGSLPGGGAEILVDRVRQAVSPRKVSTERWLAVCRAWHALGGRGSATMMFGHLETLAQRIEHLERIRRLQDDTGGFTAFIAWTFQPDHTGLAHLPKVGPFEYLKTLAVSRLYLDNIANLQASWVTQGLAIGQMALRFGANDLGSLMIEENVVAAAGTCYRATEPALRTAIAAAGFAPRRRNVFYELVGEGTIGE